MNAYCKILINPLPVSDEDIIEGMRALPGYVDIAVSDFKELYRTIYSLASRRVAYTIVASDIMCNPVLCVAETATLEAVVAFLGCHGISGAPVVDDAGRIAGVISEKDILRNFGLESMTRSIQLLGHEEALSPERIDQHKKTAVRDVMTRPALTVSAASPLADVLNLFKRESINRIPVVTHEKAPIGMITRNDIIEAFSLILP